MLTKMLIIIPKKIRQHESKKSMVVRLWVDWMERP